MTTTTTNYGWTIPSDTDLVTNGASAMRTLGQGIDTSLVGLKGGTTGQILSKTSGTDMAFTWIANDQGDLTAITAGTGISVTSGTGPIPSVAIDTAVTADLTTAQTLTNKKLSDSTTTIVDVTDATKAVKFDVGGTTAITGTIATNFTTAKTITIPDATDTLVGKATTDTLTNKTLTSPVLTTPTISTATTNGDLLYGTGSGALTRLGIGSSAQVLTVSGGVPTWATPSGTSFPAFSAYRGTSNQTIADSTWTKVQLNAENFDTANCFDSTTNYRFTPTVAGYYQLNASIFMLATTGQTYVAIYKNGTSYQTMATYGNSLYMAAGILMYLNGSSDYIELYGYQDSGSSSSIRFASNATNLSGVGVKS